MGTHRKRVAWMFLPWHVSLTPAGTRGPDAGAPPLSTQLESAPLLSSPSTRARPRLSAGRARPSSGLRRHPRCGRRPGSAEHPGDGRPQRFFAKRCDQNPDRSPVGLYYFIGQPQNNSLFLESYLHKFRKYPLQILVYFPNQQISVT